MSKGFDEQFFFHFDVAVTNEFFAVMCVQSWPMFFFVPCLSFPWIHFYNSSLTATTAELENKKGVTQQSLPGDVVANETLTNDDVDSSMTTLNDLGDPRTVRFFKKRRRPFNDGSYGSTFNHFLFFMTAPITKFYSGMVPDKWTLLETQLRIARKEKLI